MTIGVIRFNGSGRPCRPTRSPACTAWLRTRAAARCSARASTSHIETYDETNRRVVPARIIRDLQRRGGRALVGIVGVQSNQFFRAVDLARPVSRRRKSPCCIGGFHVSGCIAMLPEMPAELREAQAMGISFFAGESEERRLDDVLRDAWAGTLKPLYNYMDDLPSLENEPAPILPSKHVAPDIGFAVQHRSRPRLPVSMFVLHHHQRAGPQEPVPFARRSRTHHPRERRPGHQALLHHGRQLRPQPPMGAVFDRLIDIRKARGRKSASRSRSARSATRSRASSRRRAAPASPRVHRAREHQSGQPDRCEEAPEQDHRISRHAAEMARARRHYLCGLHPRLPRPTPRN